MTFYINAEIAATDLEKFNIWNAQKNVFNSVVYAQEVTAASGESDSGAQLGFCAWSEAPDSDLYEFCVSFSQDCLVKIDITKAKAQALLDCALITSTHYSNMQEYSDESPTAKTKINGAMVGPVIWDFNPAYIVIR